MNTKKIIPHIFIKDDYAGHNGRKSAKQAIKRECRRALRRHLNKETEWHDPNSWLPETDYIVDRERKENKISGVKHFSLKTRKILDEIWNIDEKIMDLTSANCP